MPAELLPYITGPAAAVVVLIWWVWTLRKDLAEKDRTIAAERKRADSSEEAARTANHLLSGLMDRGPRRQDRSQR